MTPTERELLVLMAEILGELYLESMAQRCQRNVAESERINEFAKLTTPTIMRLTKLLDALKTTQDAVIDPLAILTRRGGH